MANEELLPWNYDQPRAKDVKRLVLQHVHYWYLFLMGATLSMAVAYLYLRYYAVPQYSVYSTVLIKDDKSGQSLSNADAFADLSAFKSTRNIDNELEVIKSKSLMTKVVRELGLSTSYYLEGQVRNSEIYGRDVPIKVLVNRLKSNALDKTFTVYLKPDNTFDWQDYTGHTASYRFGQQIHKPYGDFTVVAAAQSATEGKVIVRFEDIQQLADYYNQAIVVQPVNKNASVLILSLIDPLPEKAKDIINGLMDEYNKEAIEDKNIMAANTLRFLDDRLQYLTSELSGVEKVVERYKSANGLTDISTQASNYTEQASNYRTQLSEWAIQIDVLESIESYLEKTVDRYSMVPSTLGIKDETLLGLIDKFNELQLERERMLRTTQPGNPLVQNMNEQLANLRINILENLKNIRRGLQITSNNLRASSGQFQSKIKRVPAMERQLLEINRQQSIKQNIYVYLLQKREETALSLAATASAARVLDSARGGDYPISPNIQVIYLMALLLGLGLPLAGIYVSNLLNTKIQTQQDVTGEIIAPVIGEIAHSSKAGVVITNKRSPIAEMFRLVRANLQFATADKERVVLLVTSSMSGEGKTFFSINIGATLALTGKRVVLLDLNLREPGMAAELELPEGKGVTDYLLGTDTGIQDIIRQSEKVPDLFVVSAGPAPANPAELIMGAKLAHLIQELRELFDYLIIDTPAVGQVADAFALGRFVDFTIYIVRYNYTHKAQLDIIKNIQKNKILNQPMIVLNDAKEENGSNYGYGYGYGQAGSKKKVAH